MKTFLDISINFSFHFQHFPSNQTDSKTKCTKLNLKLPKLRNYIKSPVILSQLQLYKKAQYIYIYILGFDSSN
jgi:hypothetical protein